MKCIQMMIASFLLIQMMNTRLDSVLGRFRKHNLFLTASKCSFGFKEFEFVGKVVSEAGLKESQQKIQAFLDYYLP